MMGCLSICIVMLCTSTLFSVVIRSSALTPLAYCKWNAGKKLEACGTLLTRFSNSERNHWYNVRSSSKNVRRRFYTGSVINYFIQIQSITRFAGGFKVLELRGGNSTSESDGSDSFTRLAADKDFEDLADPPLISARRVEIPGPHSYSDSDSCEDAQVVDNLLASTEEEETEETRNAGITHFGWAGKVTANRRFTVVPDDTFPELKTEPANVTSHFKAMGLPEAVQVCPPGGTILIRKGEYKWQLGGCGVYYCYFENELEGDPILVPYPISIIGERRSHDIMHSGIFAAEHTPRCCVRLFGQWLLTAPLENMNVIWKPQQREGIFDNLLLMLRTSRTPANLVEARGGNWRFARCQLRAVLGGVALACFGRSRVSAVECGLGGVGQWSFDALGGVIAYEKSEVIMSSCTLEWTRSVGEGLRLWDSAAARLDKCVIRYNGVGAAMGRAAQLTASDCRIYGSDFAALAAFGNTSAAVLHMAGGEICGRVWFDGIAVPRPGQDGAPRRPGTVRWVSVQVREDEAVPRPRGWRPMMKRPPTVTSGMTDDGEEWSSTDTLGMSDKEDPFPGYDVEDIDRTLATDYALLARHFRSRDVALARAGCNI